MGDAGVDLSPFALIADHHDVPPPILIDAKAAEECLVSLEGPEEAGADDETHGVTPVPDGRERRDLVLSLKCTRIRGDCGVIPVTGGR